MMPTEFIRAKRDNHQHSPAEMEAFFLAYLNQQGVADYQVSAWLMAALLRGLDPEETCALTQIMLDSGAKLEWEPALFSRAVDKHSTGGVGDKASILMIPMCMQFDLLVPMMAGRGLGHTGGTIDKLESIPGMKLEYSLAEAREKILQDQVILMSQSQELAPLDKKLYALRDVTSTVESISLITASILSKKLCEGISSLVLDLKVGTGAFLSTMPKAEAFAELFAATASRLGINGEIVFSDMTSPLGRNAGNALEILEVMDILKSGKIPEDDGGTYALSKELVCSMLASIDSAGSPGLKAEAAATLDQALVSGKLHGSFHTWISSQHGRLDGWNPLDTTLEKKPVYASQNGMVNAIDCRQLGLAVVALGGGRRALDSVLDYGVGLTGLKHIGEQVDSKEPLCFIYFRTEEQFKEAAAIIQRAYQVGSEDGVEVEKKPRILKRMPWKKKT